MDCREDATPQVKRERETDDQGAANVGDMSVHYAACSVSEKEDSVRGVKKSFGCTRPPVRATMRSMTLRRGQRSPAIYR